LLLNNSVPETELLWPAEYIHPWGKFKSPLRSILARFVMNSVCPDVSRQLLCHGFGNDTERFDRAVPDMFAPDLPWIRPEFAGCIRTITRLQTEIFNWIAPRLSRLLKCRSVILLHFCNISP
jgi:hypothetical protein